MIIPILAIIGAAALAGYGFGWVWRGRYEQPYIDQMRDTLQDASDELNDRLEAPDLAYISRRCWNAARRP